MSIILKSKSPAFSRVRGLPPKSQHPHPRRQKTLDTLPSSCIQFTTSNSRRSQPEHEQNQECTAAKILPLLVQPNRAPHDTSSCRNLGTSHSTTITTTVATRLQAKIANSRSVGQPPDALTEGGSLHGSPHCRGPGQCGTRRSNRNRKPRHHRRSARVSDRAA